MPWDESQEYIRSGHRDPDDFDADSFRIITISEEEGIKAVVACPKGHFTGGRCDVGTEIQSYLFSKEKGWTMDKAKAWFEEHRVRTESFRWVPTDRFFLPEGATGKLYKVVALKEGKTQHYTEDGKRFERVFSHHEIDRLAGGFTFEPARSNLNFDHFENEKINGRIVDAEEEGGNLELIVYIDDEKFQRMFDGGHIKGVSIEYYARDEKEVDGLAQLGVVPAGLAVITDRFGEGQKPASSGTSISYWDGNIIRVPSSQIEYYNPSKMAKIYKEVTEKMKEEEFMRQLKEIQKLQIKILMAYAPVSAEASRILDSIQKEQFADLPDSDFACIIGEGETKERKLPIHDADHVRNAMARFNQTIGCQTEEVRARICARAKQFGIESAFQEGGFCYKGESQSKPMVCGLRSREMDLGDTAELEDSFLKKKKEARPEPRYFAKRKYPYL